MKRYFQSWWIRIGAALLVLGSGPLIAIMVAARLGFTADPNPNPVYIGMLAGLTFWPSLGIIAIGVWRARGAARAASAT